MVNEPNISHEFPFESRFMKIKGSRLHYIEVGEGDPIVFVHGVPTSSYLWRNIIPCIQSQARCIAPDLIGYGLSDKPKIKYTLDDHIEYFNTFITSLNLEKITFVLHGWGSVIGFNYIAQNMNKVKGVVFYEAHLHPETDWNQLSLPIQQLLALRQKSNLLEKAILKDNYLLKKIFPLSMLHLPDKKILKKYCEPFEDPNNRQPLLQYIYDLPIGENCSHTAALISSYSNALSRSLIPKLLLYAVPGFLTPIETVKWCRNNFKNLEIVDLGEELHFAQETMPKHFGQILNTWYEKIN